MSKPLPPKGTPVPIREFYKLRDAVGFGSPPKEHQFKPGQSGNKKGRPKKLRTFPLQDLQSVRQLETAIGNRLVPVAVNGKKKQITVVEAIWMKRVQDALGGDMRAQEAILKAHRKAATVKTNEREKHETIISQFVHACHTKTRFELTDFMEDTLIAITREYLPELLLEVLDGIKMQKESPPHTWQKTGVLVLDRNKKLKDDEEADE